MLKSFALTALVLAGCAATSAVAALPVYGFVVKNTYPHDPQAFTQGLFFRNGQLFETTGIIGRSTLRRLDLKTGKVLQQAALPRDVFGEGSTAVGEHILGLTWQSKTGYVFDAKTFTLKGKFPYEGEGWGLASDARHVYMSDGSASIRVLDPATLKEVRRVPVTAEGKPIASLNELEIVDGELYANVWGTDIIARIDPASGKVTGWIDLTNLLPREKRGTSSVDAVLNGIAYDDKQRKLYVTGKFWPKLFEIELVRFEGR
ncbi:glutaminyl-peptide cyclotransferase [Massilia jejuensis]|uniref:Glutaminyl-peptide cyclotransferase n=1 Tax=Massilia jejuensis TaxID=648894 RepID=A0ABW0PFM6_9BURK